MRISVAPETSTRFLMFRGLPEGLKFSAGFQVKSSWAVSITDLQKLKLIPSPDYQGAFVLDVTAHSADGTVVAQSVLNVSVEPIPPETSQTATVYGSPAETVQEKPKLAAPDMSVLEQQRLLQHAQKLMDTGLVAAARLLYKKLDEQGNAQASYAMAQSYDPLVLKSMQVVGLTPDVEQARKWYRRAADLGFAPASDRLSALEASR